jgi:hypothetical protein
VTKKNVRGSRKKPPRRKRPDRTAAFIELHKNPTPAMLASREAFIAAKKAGKFTRAGIPNGYTRETVAPLWAKANKLADRFIAIMKEQGDLPEITVPDTDAGKAEVALREAFVLAVGPSDQKIKIQAINTVLNFTKSRPESKSKLTLNKAEDFLDAIANGSDDT